MARSSEATRAERLNAALALLNQSLSLAEAAAQLVSAHGISKRQAYRYLNEAQKQSQPVPVPARKIAFTVKLSEDLIARVRAQARRRGQSLSSLVAQALEAFLGRGREDGRE